MSNKTTTPRAARYGRTVRGPCWTVTRETLEQFQAYCKANGLEVSAEIEAAIVQRMKDKRQEMESVCHAK